MVKLKTDTIYLFFSEDYRRELAILSFTQTRGQLTFCINQADYKNNTVFVNISAIGYHILGWTIFDLDNQSLSSSNTL